MENTYLPRVWTEEGYYYPVFSEFGIIYENKNLPFDEEHIKDLDWAFQFHFTGNDIDFVHILERPTGLRDKNGKLIFEGDIIKIPDKWDDYGLMAGEQREVYFLAGGFRLKPKYKYSKNDRGYWLEDTDDFEIIGNIHENPKLLEQNNDNR